MMAAPALKTGQNVQPFGDWGAAAPEWKCGDIIEFTHASVTVITTHGHRLELSPSRMTWKKKLVVWAAWPDSLARRIAVIQDHERKADALGAGRLRVGGPMLGDYMRIDGVGGFIRSLNANTITISTGITLAGAREHRVSSRKATTWDDDHDCWSGTSNPGERRTRNKR